MRSEGDIARRLLLAIGVLAGVALLAACGSSSPDDSPGPSLLRGTTASFPDYLDPSLSYTLEGISAMSETYLPLLTYAHADGAAGTRLIPGLARTLPRVTDGGRTYTLELRKGLRYSDGEPVRATDFGSTIERVLAINSPGSAFYTDIVGAEHFAETKEGDIPGIRADDRTGRIVIDLVRPRSTFANELAMLFAAPLPPGTPREDLSADPPPGTGPYEIVSSKPGSHWEYRRNPEWAKVDGPRMSRLPDGHYDRIQIGVLHNPETQVAEVERGEVDWMVNPPPTDRYADLLRRFKDTQLLVTPQIDLYYFWMNVEKAPFDDLRVRRAVNYAIDPAALGRIYAGQLQAVQQVLPPEMPGHRSYRPYPHDMAKARSLMAAADPSQRRVTVWTDDYQPNKEAGEYYEGVLRELGLQPTLKVVPGANYMTIIGNASTPDLDTGWADWYIDYPHPNDYFEPQLSSSGITPTGTSNYSRFSEPAIDRRIAGLDTEPLGPRQEVAYARLDREVMRDAPWAPFGSLTVATFISSGIDPDKLVVNPVYGQDLASFAPADHGPAR